MNDDQFDQVAREALEDERSLEPRNDQIEAVVRRVRTGHLRQMRIRRTVVALAGVLLIGAGTAFAIPQSREAITDAFGAVRDFFTGGGDPPGRPIADDEGGPLNWFRGTDTTNGSVIAQSGPVRLVAYRQTTTGMACIATGISFSGCNTDDEWRRLLASNLVIPTGPLPEPNASGELPLLGITADAITSVEIRYADGGTVAVDGVSHGFVLFADPTRKPTTLLARDESGAVVQTTDISDRQWKFTGP